MIGSSKVYPTRWGWYTRTAPNNQVQSPQLCCFEVKEIDLGVWGLLEVIDELSSRQQRKENIMLQETKKRSAPSSPKVMRWGSCAKLDERSERMEIGALSSSEARDWLMMSSEASERNQGNWVSQIERHRRQKLRNRMMYSHKTQHRPLTNSRSCLISTRVASCTKPHTRA